MEHLKALKFFIIQINKAVKEGLKGVDHVKKLFILAEHLGEVINSKNLKTIVKEAEKERKRLEWKAEKDAATKLLNKYKLYKAIAYESSLLRDLIERLHRYNVRDTFGDHEITSDIIENYKIFKNNFKNSDGYGTATKIAKVLAHHYSELNQLAEQIEAQAYDRDKIHLLNLWTLDQLP